MIEFIKQGKYESLFIFAGIFLFVNTSFSQESDPSDFETWTSAAVKYKANKKWDFGLEQQLRLKENSSVVSGYFTELNATYEPIKNFGFGAGLRFIRKNDTKGNKQGYENHLRFNLDAYFKHKLERFDFKYRLRYQNRDELGVSTSDGDFPNQYVRLKGGMEYNIRKWKLDPEFSAEIFYHSQKEDDDEGFNKYRITLGTSYKFKKAGKIGMYYRFEQEINAVQPKSTNILRIKYIYTFKKK